MKKTTELFQKKHFKILRFSRNAIFIYSFLFMSCAYAEVREVQQFNEAGTRIDELEENNRMLTGKIEELQHLINVLQEKVNGMEKSQVESYNANNQNKNTKPASSSELIASAEKQIKNKKYGLAINMLSDFLASTPKDVYRGQAFFFLGIAYDGNKDYKKASVAYMNSTKENPNGSKAPDALYNLSKALVKIGKKKEAIIVLKKLINTYESRGDIIKKAKADLSCL